MHEPDVGVAVLARSALTRYGSSSSVRSAHFSAGLLRDPHVGIDEIDAGSNSSILGVGDPCPRGPVLGDSRKRPAMTSPGSTAHAGRPSGRPCPSGRRPRSSELRALLRASPQNAKAISASG